MLRDRILGLFRAKKIRFKRFRDPLGNFEIFYPEGWKFDRDIAVVNGKYTVAFERGDRHFTIAVDTSLPPDFEFGEYAKSELEGPSSGIIADLKRERFQGMPSFSREYRFDSGGKAFFGGGTMFFTGRAVFSVSWSAPEKDEGPSGRIFRHMLKSLAVREGLTIRAA